MARIDQTGYAPRHSVAEEIVAFLPKAPTPIVAKTSGPIHGRFAGVILAGYDIGSDATALEVSSTTAMTKTTSILARPGWGGGETYSPGTSSNKVNLKGWFDDNAATGVYTAVDALEGSYVVATFLPAGDVFPGYVALMGGLTQVSSDLKIASPVSGTVTLDASFTISGLLDTGIVLVPRQTITGTGVATRVGSVLDNTVATTNGASAHFHITAAPSGGGSLTTFVVQTSADNATWTTIMTSTLPGNAIGADRRTYAGTISRYVQVLATAPSGQTTTVAVAFRRN